VWNAVCDPFAALPAFHRNDRFGLPQTPTEGRNEALSVLLSSTFT
jgi:hypothetical protein